MKWWRKRAPDTDVSPRAELAWLDDRQDAVTELGRELRARQLQNNFSGMVAVAIARASEGA